MTHPDALILLKGIIIAWWIGWVMGFASGQSEQKENK
jgi:hypothetical protein